MKSKNQIIQAGMNPHFIQEHFSAEEKSILIKLSQYFYLTNGGKKITHFNSEYQYCLLKFTTEMQQSFGINFELVVLFSPYDRFEPRTLDIIEKIEENIGSSFRLDKICTIVISKCPTFLESLNSMLKRITESRVIIPFTYQEFENNCNESFFKERIRKYFFQRDLFDFQAPLKKGLYFFGRDQIVHSLIDKHEQGEISGIFGLRKSGKTSILYAIHRNLEKKGIHSAIIDCQSLYQGRWYDALYSIVSTLNRDFKAKIQIDKNKYDQDNAKESFEYDILKIYKKLNMSQRILLIFDEIEHLTYGISSNPDWGEKMDYMYFWNIIRAHFQRTDGCFNFLISGTNASCVETPKIKSADNPLFAQFKPTYLVGFSLEQTEQMVSTLSKYMGIKFDKEIYTYLTDEFGGHPFLIRQMCSFLCKKIKEYGNNENIDKAFYHAEKASFDADNYCEMIIGILKDSYEDEFTMLEYLAYGNIEDFYAFAESDNNYIKHLLGYGIIREFQENKYSLNIDVVKDYLIKKNKYKRLNLTDEEKRTEISERRNKIEINLRNFIKKIILEEYGRKQATQYVQNILQSQLSDYNDLFDVNKNKSLYFISLGDLIYKNQQIWGDCFQNIFHKQSDVKAHFDLLNNIKIGRADAHAVDITEVNFNTFRTSMDYFENILEEYNRKIQQKIQS